MWIVNIRYHNRHHFRFVGPMRQIKQRMLIASKEAPVHASHKVEVGSSEVERASIEHYRPTPLVYLPQSSTIRTAFAFVKQISMQIDVAKLQHPILVYYEFLIHYVPDIVYKQRHCRLSDVKIHKKHERRKLLSSCYKKMFYKKFPH